MTSTTRLTTFLLTDGPFYTFALVLFGLHVGLGLDNIKRKNKSVQFDS